MHFGHPVTHHPFAHGLGLHFGRHFEIICKFKLFIDQKKFNWLQIKKRPKWGVVSDQNFPPWIPPECGQAFCLTLAFGDSCWSRNMWSGFVPKYRKFHSQGAIQLFTDHSPVISWPLFCLIILSFAVLLNLLVLRFLSANILALFRFLLYLLQSCFENPDS